jgi:hypothetical protein
MAAQNQVVALLLGVVAVALLAPAVLVATALLAA